MLRTGLAVTACTVGGGSTAAQAAGICGAGTFAATATEASCTFATPGTAVFTVPAAVSELAVTVIGGRGGTSGITCRRLGGAGARIRATLPTSPGTVYDLTVASNGTNLVACPGGGTGFGGGGAGGDSLFAWDGAGGGGASRLAKGGTDLLVAGGGGGAGGAGTSQFDVSEEFSGGAAGEAGTGCIEFTPCGGPGQPGTLSAGGAVGTGGTGAPDAGDTAGGSAGSLGQGGQGMSFTGFPGSQASKPAAGGGGGGGVYGGGGGGATKDGFGGGGGGGSSASLLNGATIDTDPTGAPGITFTWPVSTPTLTLTIRDATTGAAWTDPAYFDTAAPFPRALLGGLTSSPATGEAVYESFPNGTCSGTPLDDDGVSVGAGSSIPDGGALGGLDAGTYSFRARYFGDQRYGSATACTAFTLSKRPQTITVQSSPPVPARYGDTYQPSVVGGPAQSPVAWSIAPESQTTCALAGLTVRFLKAGTCNLQFDQGGTNNYEAAPRVTQSITVLRRALRIDAADLVSTYGEAPGAPTWRLRVADLVAGDTPSNLGESGAPACARTPHPSEVGTYAGVVRCTPGTLQSDRYEFVEGDPASLEIRRAPQALRITAAPTTGSYGDTPAITAEGGGSGQPIVLTVAPASAAICQVRGAGLELTGVGTCEFSAAQAGSANYEPAPAQTRQLVVEPAVVQVDAVPISAAAGAPLTPTFSLRGLRRGERPADAGVTGTAACAVGPHGAAGIFVGVIRCTPGSLAAPNYRFVEGTPADLALSANAAPLTELAAVGLPQVSRGGEGAVTLSTRCTAQSGACQVTATLTTAVRRRGGKVVGVSRTTGNDPRRALVAIGSRTVTVSAGRPANVTVRLNRTGRRLLARFRSVPSTLELTLGQGASAVRISSWQLTLRAPSRRR